MKIIATLFLTLLVACCNNTKARADVGIIQPKVEAKQLVDEPLSEPAKKSWRASLYAGASFLDEPNGDTTNKCGCISPLEFNSIEIEGIIGGRIEHLLASWYGSGLEVLYMPYNYQGTMTHAVGQGGLHMTGDIIAFFANPLFVEYAFGKWKPYAGAGAGFGVVSTDTIEGTGKATGWAKNARYEDVCTAGQVYAGCSYAIDETWSVFGEYKYINFWDVTTSAKQDSNYDTRFSDMGFHSVVVGLSANF